MAFRAGKSDASMVVWIGIIGLLFLAVAVHEGWFSGAATPGDGADGVSPGLASDVAALPSTIADDAGDALSSLLATLNIF